MALGNSYNNNGKNSDVYNPTVYSPYRMNNAESSVDKTRLSFSFWNNFLKISIDPKKDTGNDDVQFDTENNISIHLNHTKARIFADVLRKFKEDPEKYDNSGVPSGQGLITISRGLEFNSSCPLIIIRKIDNDGTVLSTYVYQIKGDYYFSVRGYSEDGKYDKESDSYALLEIDQIITLLEEYYKSMTMATAFTVLDQLKYEHRRQQTSLNKIAEKLGVELSGSGSSRNYSSSSYFANGGGSSNSNSNGNNNKSYTQATMDDIG